MNKMDKFLNKCRIGSTRLPKWDYRWKGAYFITICCKNREHYFGEISDNKMQLSEIGIIADILWYEIKNHAQNVDLGAFVVMPNHVHGILILNNWIDTENNTIALTRDVETTHALSLRPSEQQSTEIPYEPSIKMGQKRFQNQGKNSVSSIIGSYKSAISKHAHRLGFDFEWQERFYDNIIRDDEAFNTISEYIVNNPKRWKDDRFYPPDSD